MLIQILQLVTKHINKLESKKAVYTPVKHNPEVYAMKTKSGVITTIDTKCSPPHISRHTGSGQSDVDSGRPYQDSPGSA